MCSTATALTSGSSSPGPGVHTVAGFGAADEALDDDGPPGVTVEDGVPDEDGPPEGEPAPGDDAEEDAEEELVAPVAPVVGELVAAPPTFPCEESHAVVTAAAPSAAMPL